MEALEDKLKDAILRAAKKITAEHPELNQPEEVIAAYLIANTVCISRHTLKGLEILKGHFTNNLNQLLAALPGISDFGSGASITGPDPRGMLTRFLNQTGLRLGSVRGKAALFQFLDVRELLQYRKPLYYAPKGDYPIYFETRTGFLELEVFKRFKDRLNAKENNPHHQCIMGQATLKLTEGLLNKISDEGWKKIKEDFGLCALAQTALVRLQINLANADFHLGVNDESYSKAIELALAELSTLLTIFSPFAKGDFEQIYKRQLTNIPSELQNLVTIGIAKSAMNIFSGIKAAVDQTLPPNKEAVCEVGKEVYYEILQSLEKKVKESKPADLYVDEFYHNIVLIPSHTHYSSTDIIHSVTKLMETKPERVTVAIDDTIDFARSEKASALMKHLSKEIREGQVNLIFFRSGQKFDMLGMDNYYGAPFYMLKNGDPHWSTFDALFKHDAHQTDPLTIQWFCLANQSVFEEMESYRLQIFENTREILNHIPDSLKPRKGSTLYVCTSDPDVLAPFIEIKATTEDDASSLHNFITSLQNTFIERKRPLYSRDSFGFTHANFILINHKVQQCTSIRLAPGINPLESRLIIEALEELSSEQSQK